MNRGFTLLEVLVSVAILGLGLTAILSAQAGAFASAAHARNISVATGLLRCKMSEVEEHLYRDGFQDTDETGTGACCEAMEDPVNMHCSWHVNRPQFPESKLGDLNLNAGLDFGSSGSGAPGGLPGGLGALGMLAGAPGAMGGGASPLGSASSITDVAKIFSDANSQALSPGGMPPGGMPIDPSTGMPMDPYMTPIPQSPGVAPAGWPSSSSSSGSGWGSSTSSSSGMMGGPPTGGDMMGGMASLAMSFVYPSLKLLFEASTRRITATLTFREGHKEYTIDVVEWFSVPQLGLPPNTDDPTDPTTGTTTTPPTATTGRSGPLPQPLPHL